MKRGPLAATKQRVEEYLAKVAPGVNGAERSGVGHMETITFLQQVEGTDRPWRLPAINMSDGTLRALGVLVALLQKPERGDIPLVGIEEPEVAIYPAAAGVLRDCLREASRNTQILVTSHSPDLLDDPMVSSDMVLAVVADKGETTVGPVDEATRSVLRDRLFTAGELLRADQLRPDPATRKSPEQLQLFESAGP
jgi:predicted ATPase